MYYQFEKILEIYFAIKFISFQKKTWNIFILFFPLGYKLL
jgi:hypothetical protein